MEESETIEKLYRLTIELGTTLDEGHEVQVFLDWLRQNVDPAFAALYLSDDRKRYLEPAGVLGAKGRLPRIPLGDDLWRRLAEHPLEVPLDSKPRYSVPLVAEGQLFGVLAVVSRSTGSALRREKRLVGAAVSYLAPVLRNIWRFRNLESEVRKRTQKLAQSEANQRRLSERLRALRLIDRATLEARTLPEIAEIAGTEIQKLLPDVRALVLEVIPEESMARAFHRARWFRRDVPRNLPCSLEKAGLVDALLIRQEKVRLTGLPESLEGKAWDLWEIVSSEEWSWLEIWPIRLGTKVPAALLLLGKRGKGCEGECEEVAEAFCEALAVAIQQDRMRKQIRDYQEDLEQKVRKRTAELQRLVNLMAGRENRMAELKEVIRILRKQLLDAGMVPLANDPLAPPEEDETGGPAR